MIRYALIILVFLALVIYVIYMAARGAISGQFRTISLSLLFFLLIMVGTGLYYNQRYYSVQTVQEEFTANKEDILGTIRDHLQNQAYEEAVALAARYGTVNDPELQELYLNSREGELLQHIENTDQDNHRQRVNLFTELLELTGKPSYKERVKTEELLLARAREEQVRSILATIPERHIARKALGFRILQNVNPEKAHYRIQYNAYRLRIESRLQNTPWNDACSRTKIPACDHFGYLAKEPDISGDKDQETVFGEIWGVSQRPKGALISTNGEVAPEDGFYYIVHEFETQSLNLYHIESLGVENPYMQK